MTDNFQTRFSALLDEYAGSYGDLSKSLNVSKQTISAWRTGTRSPKQPMVEHIAHFFNVNVPWLMGLDVERDNFVRPQVISFDGLPARDTITDEERMLIHAYRAAKPEYQAVVMDILTNHKKEE